MEWGWLVALSVVTWEVTLGEGKALFAGLGMWAGELGLEWMGYQCTELVVSLRVAAVLWVLGLNHRSLLLLLLGLFLLYSLSPWFLSLLSTPDPWSSYLSTPLKLFFQYSLGIVSFGILSASVDVALHHLNSISTLTTDNQLHLQRLAADSISALLLLLFYLFLAQLVLWGFETYSGEAPWILLKWMDGLIAYSCTMLKCGEVKEDKGVAFISIWMCGFVSIQMIRGGLAIIYTS